jgi:hypothetical protein
MKKITAMKNPTTSWTYDGAIFDRFYDFKE